jgi:radical SAM protein with 4Fe4S-binding SPASM domain
VHKAKPGDYDRVTANIRDAVSRRGNCTIGMQMVLVPENAKTVDDFKRLADTLKVEYAVLKPFSQHRFSVNKEYATFDPRQIKITDHGRTIVRRNAMDAVTSEIPYHKCLATPNFWAYLSERGDVYGCSAYLLDDRFRYGNINDETFEQIWTGEKRQESWRYVREELDISECRQSCRMNEVNKYLTGVVEGLPHRNFI